MKKILLLSLAVLSPQIFAASVELECSEDLFGMKNFFHLTEERGNGYGKKVIRYAFRIAENGEARNFYAEELNAIWNDTYIFVV